MTKNDVKNDVGRKNNERVSPIIAVILMVAITVVLGGVLWSMTSSLSLNSPKSLSAAYKKELGTQQVPTEPVLVEISSKLDVEYVLIENELLCIYELTYVSKFKYEEYEVDKQISIPLPKGSLEKLGVILNERPTNNFTVSNNFLYLSLPKNQTNIVKLSYVAFGTDKYMHSIPKNRILESFNMKLEITGIEFDYKKDLPKKCLTPDERETSGDRTVLEWNKPSSVLRKDIIINLPKKPNPFDSYLYLIPILVFLIILFAAFYQEGFRRLNKALKNEQLAFLLAPILILYLLLGMALLYLPLDIAIMIALAGYLCMMVVVNKKMIPIKKGSKEMLLLPSFAVIGSCIYLFFQNSYGLFFGTVFVILTLIVALSFFRKFKSKSRLSAERVNEKELINNSVRYKYERDQAVLQLNELYKENEQLKESRTKKAIAKHYCIYCCKNISDNFDFCPKCGRDISKIKNCPRCNILISGNEQFCPNCGLGLTPVIPKVVK